MQQNESMPNHEHFDNLKCLPLVDVSNKHYLEIAMIYLTEVYSVHDKVLSEFMKTDKTKKQKLIFIVFC